MPLLQFNIIKLTIFLVFGILTGNLIHIPISFSLSICVIVLLLLGYEHYFVSKRPSLRFAFLAALLTLFIGNLSIALTRPASKPDHYSHFIGQKEQTYSFKIREVLKSNPFSDRYTAQVIAMDSLPVSGKILLNIVRDTAMKPYRVDDEIVAFTTLKPIGSSLNPYQFDYKKYMLHQGIGHQAHIVAPYYLRKEYTSPTFFGIASKMRGRIIDKLKEEAFGYDELGIIQALLLGERNDITETINTDYRNAGAFHILSLSGLHIGIILGLLHYVLYPLERLPRGKSIKLILILLLLWGYAFLAGLSPSILRAVGMFTFIAYALHLHRPTSYYNILALSLFFILLIFNPLLLFNVGFQLSYAAVFAIVWFFPLLKKFWMPRNWLLKKGWEIIAVSLAAQLGVLPITLFYFHHFPGLFVLTSLLILPAMTFILGMGILVISLALVNALPPFLVVVYNTVIQWMNSIIAWVGQQEQFLFRNIFFDTVHFILAYGIIISWASLMDKATYRKAVCLMGCILGLQIWSQGRLFHIVGKESAFIGHVGRNSALVHQSGHRIMVYSSNPLAAERMATDYAIALNAGELINKPLKNSYRLGAERIIVLDSTLVTLPAISGDFTLWLTQSPKVNLDRILDSVRPKVVVADGNNYRSYIGRWKATCMKKRIPFHYTGDKGAFIFEFP